MIALWLYGSGLLLGFALIRELAYEEPTEWSLYMRAALLLWPIVTMAAGLACVVWWRMLGIFRTVRP